MTFPAPAPENSKAQLGFLLIGLERTQKDVVHSGTQTLLLSHLAIQYDKLPLIHCHVVIRPYKAYLVKMTVIKSSNMHTVILNQQILNNKQDQLESTVLYILFKMVEDKKKIYMGIDPACYLIPSTLFLHWL